MSAMASVLTPKSSGSSVAAGLFDKSGGPPGEAGEMLKNIVGIVNKIPGGKELLSTAAFTVAGPAGKIAVDLAFETLSNTGDQQTQGAGQAMAQAASADGDSEVGDMGMNKLAEMIKDLIIPSFSGPKMADK